MDTTPKLLKYHLACLVLLVGLYVLCLYYLNVYKYQTSLPAQTGVATANGKSIFCGIFVLFFVYVVYFGYRLFLYPKSSFYFFASVLYGMLYVLLGILFFIEKFVSKTLLPDKLNSQVEMLVCYPVLLGLLLVSLSVVYYT